MLRPHPDGWRLGRRAGGRLVRDIAAGGREVRAQCGIGKRNRDAIFHKRILNRHVGGRLVTDRELSRHILAACPRRTGYTAGTLKRKGMSFLAPQALTIAEDAEWDRLRPFNERVLCSGRPHDFQRAFLGQVRRGFEASVGSMEQVRESMGRVMLGIVFGEGVAPARLVADIISSFSDRQAIMMYRRLNGIDPGQVTDYI